MKKIITITMIKNEADIVETFVRYTMNFASKMIFIDNGSTDGSTDILKMLKKEGMNIDLYYEADSFYEQYIIENKYIKKVTKEDKFDFLIPLDVDEFLASHGKLLEEFEKISNKKVSLIRWVTYVVTSKKDCEGFFLDAIKNIRLKESLTFTKIILPYDVLKEKRILVGMGHHDIETQEKDLTVKNDDIYIAHFPVRSETQIKLKIYQGVLAQLMSSYHCVVAFHWKKLLLEFQNRNFDIVEYSLHYALPQNDVIDLNKDVKESQFNYIWCKKSICPRYNEWIKSDVLENIYRFAEVICLKSIINDKKDNFGRQRIFIWGTGNTAKNFFNYIGTEEYNILAYVDSNLELEYSVFNNKLVIAPDKIKNFSYDKIIIASNAYNEIKEILLSLGVCEKKIYNKMDVVEDKIYDDIKIME